MFGWPTFLFYFSPKQNDKTLVEPCALSEASRLDRIFKLAPTLKSLRRSSVFLPCLLASVCLSPAVLLKSRSSTACQPHGQKLGTRLSSEKQECTHQNFMVIHVTEFEILCKHQNFAWWHSREGSWGIQNWQGSPPKNDLQQFLQLTNASLYWYRLDAFQHFVFDRSLKRDHANISL